MICVLYWCIFLKLLTKIPLKAGGLKFYWIERSSLFQAYWKCNQSFILNRGKFVLWCMRNCFLFCFSFYVYEDWLLIVKFDWFQFTTMLGFLENAYTVDQIWESAIKFNNWFLHFTEVCQIHVTLDHICYLACTPYVVMLVFSDLGEKKERPINSTIHNRETWSF